MTKFDMLAQVGQIVLECKKCPLLASNRTQTVFGEGNVDADVVLLGEGPGRAEDESGRPFVGQAGMLLDNMIKACGWRRQDVYILNVVKCRPPQNRAPLPEEAANCRGFLDLQLRIIKPKYIICLGNTAAQNLLSVRTVVSALRGRWFQYKGAKVMATFHPSYLLRNPEAKKDVWADLQMVLEDMK